MINPVLSIRFAVQCGGLDVYGGVSRIEVFIADGGGFPGERRGDLHAGEEGRCD